MSRRIDIELTSRRDDGSWTWRAPGARQPRGTVEGALLPGDAKVGLVMRADADFGIDGIVVVAVLPAKVDPRTERAPERIEVVGSKTDAPEGVSVVLASGGRRRPEGRDDEGRRPRPGRDRDREDRPRRSAPADGPDGGRPSRSGADRARPDRAPRGRPADGARSRADASPRAGEQTGGEAAGRPSERRGPRRAPTARTEQPDRRRLQALTTNRNAVLADLRAEQLPVAEQLLRGGIPAVRQAIEEQNARARAEGRTEVSPEPLLAMAEELLPKINLATWKDRATAARNAGKDAPLREVRSVVAGASTVMLDEEGRGMLTALRESLDTRVTALRDAWVARVTTALDEGRIADALRVATRPPEPATRISAQLALRLSESAGSAMTPDVPEAEWKALLDAVVDSPVRRTVKPVGLPRDAGEELLTAARRAAGLVPELAKLFGLPIPPPPGPRRPVAARRA